MKEIKLQITDRLFEEMEKSASKHAKNKDVGELASALFGLDYHAQYYDSIVIEKLVNAINTNKKELLVYTQDDPEVKIDIQATPNQPKEEEESND